MRKSKLVLLASLLVAPLFLGAAGEAETGGSHTIRVLNLDDYIFIDEEDRSNDLIHQFERHANEKFGFTDVKVIYDVSDTNESEYNDLLTGRINYDLVCTSDYMLQKFVSEDLVVPLDSSKLENYTTYASSKIKSYLDTISVTKDGQELFLEDYAVGYMWGTLGLLVNPNYDLMKSRNISSEQALSDAQSWDILWNNSYYNCASIKNSMRDTYAIGLMHAYDNELNILKVSHNEGEIDDEHYHNRLTEIFNDTADRTLTLVSNEFYTLKQNIFGMEVDSGKQDIVTGKIGINVAWSGDAVYSMDLAEETANPFELYYSIPENGSNIWFDGWAMPKNDNRAAITRDIALEFLNFISHPDNAAQNMDYTGYTPFIGGDSILDLTRDWYDARTDYIYYFDEEEESYSLYFIDPESGEETEVWYEHCFDVNEPDPAFDNVELYYFLEDEEGVEQKITLVDENENPIYFNDQLAFDFSEYEEVNLSYFFNSTLQEYENDVDTIFYTEYYLEPFEGNVSVGRQFFCQFPDEETILRCSVMKDYGEDNLKVVKLWEESKSTPLPLWAVITLIVIVTLIIGVIVYIYLGKNIKKKLRKKRLQNAKPKS